MGQWAETKFKSRDSILNILLDFSNKICRFYVQFSAIALLSVGLPLELTVLNIINSLSEVENVSQPDPNSVSYSPQIIQFLLTYYMPIVPLWSGIILSTVNSKGSPTDSNAIAENWT